MDRIYFHIIQGAAETMEVSAVNTVVKGDAGVGRANVIIGVLFRTLFVSIYVTFTALTQGDVNIVVIEDIKDLHRKLSGQAAHKAFAGLTIQNGRAVGMDNIANIGAVVDLLRHFGIATAGSGHEVGALFGQFVNGSKVFGTDHAGTVQQSTVKIAGNNLIVHGVLRFM